MIEHAGLTTIHIQKIDFGNWSQSMCLIFDCPASEPPDKTDQILKLSKGFMRFQIFEKAPARVRFRFVGDLARVDDEEPLM
jgi:hypothetical protein